MPRKKKEEVEKRTHLTNEEMLKMDMFAKNNEIINLKIAIKRKESELLESKRQLLQKDIELNGRNILDLQNEISSLKAKSAEFVKELVKELNVTSSKFGYNPNTGEVIEN